MNALDRLEAFLQELMERPGALLTPKRMLPLQLAGALSRELEGHALRLSDRILIPNDYEISVSRADWHDLEAVRTTLESELGEYILRVAAERTLTLAATPRVRMRPDERLRNGETRLSSFFHRSGIDRRPIDSHLEPGTVLEKPRHSRTEPLRPVRQQRRPPAAAGPPCLVLLGPEDQELRRFPLDNGVVSIGRRSDNDIAIPDLKMSRHHARLETDGPRFYLVDLDSTNGTRLNGRDVTHRTSLTPGDTVEIGLQRFRFDA